MVRTAFPMSPRSTIIIDHIPILLESSGRAQRLSISVKPFRGVRVAVPYHISFSQAERAIHSKMSWIRHHHARMREVEKSIEQSPCQEITIDRVLAEKTLTGRLRELAARYGYKVNRVSVRNQKTRWGSCSARNNISLNMKLILLPDTLIDFVLLHELVHTRIKNHGQEFWTELAGLLPGENIKELRVQMRKHGLRVL